MRASFARQNENHKKKLKESLEPDFVLTSTKIPLPASRPRSSGAARATSAPRPPTPTSSLRNTWGNGSGSSGDLARNGLPRAPLPPRPPARSTTPKASRQSPRAQSRTDRQSSPGSAPRPGSTPRSSATPSQGFGTPRSVQWGQDSFQSYPRQTGAASWQDSPAAAPLPPRPPISAVEPALPASTQATPRRARPGSPSLASSLNASDLMNLATFVRQRQDDEFDTDDEVHLLLKALSVALRKKMPDESVPAQLHSALHSVPPLAFESVDEVQAYASAQQRQAEPVRSIAKNGRDPPSMLSTPRLTPREAAQPEPVRSVGPSQLSTPRSAQLDAPVSARAALAKAAPFAVANGPVSAASQRAPGSRDVSRQSTPRAAASDAVASAATAKGAPLSRQSSARDVVPNGSVHAAPQQQGNRTSDLHENAARPDVKLNGVRPLDPRQGSKNRSFDGESYSDGSYSDDDYTSESEYSDDSYSEDSYSASGSRHAAPYRSRSSLAAPGGFSPGQKLREPDQSLSPGFQLETAEEVFSSRPVARAPGWSAPANPVAEIFKDESNLSLPGSLESLQEYLALLKLQEKEILRRRGLL